MSVFSDIFDKFLGKIKGLVPGANTLSDVNLTAELDKLAKGRGLEWKTSVVDFLKLISANSHEAPSTRHEEPTPCSPLAGARDGGIANGRASARSSRASCFEPRACCSSYVRLDEVPVGLHPLAPLRGVLARHQRVAPEVRRMVDTAPTGHTLLLRDATGAYHHEIMRHAKEGMNLVTPLMRLQDPKQTKILIVTLAQTTPVLEAAALQADLRRAGIEPWAWVINSSLAAGNPRNPLLAARAQSELPQIKKVADELAKRAALVPWLSAEPIGTGHLRELVRELASEAPVLKERKCLHTTTDVRNA